MKLQIRAFFFNAKTDYLPYYKNFTIRLSDDATAQELLLAIREQNEHFAFPEVNPIFRINGLVVSAEEKMSNIIEALGRALQIDPASSYRSTHALCFNDNDFMESYALLEPYCDESDLAYYKSLYPLHYASETSHFKRDYIGDAILLLAYRLIKKDSRYKTEILKAISEANSGLFDCEYENNLFDAQDHTETIRALKAMAKETSEAMPFLFKVLCSKIMGKSKNTKKQHKPQKCSSVSVGSIAGKNTAYYSGTDLIHPTMIEEIQKAGAKAVRFSRETKSSGVTLLEDSRRLALTKAGTNLLDAFDHGAVVLIVENEEDFEMFTGHHKAIESVMGREIGLEFLLASDFLSSNQQAKA